MLASTCKKETQLTQDHTAQNGVQMGLDPDGLPPDGALRKLAHECRGNI